MEEQNLDIIYGKWIFKPSNRRSSTDTSSWSRSYSLKVYKYNNSIDWKILIYFNDIEMKNIYKKLYGYYGDKVFYTAKEGKEHIDNFLKQFNKLKAFI